MPILVELGRDETVQVRVEAIETIVKVLPFLSQELIKVSVIPLIKKIFEQAMIAVDDTLVMVSKQFGSLCIGLESKEILIFFSFIQILRCFIRLYSY